MMDYRLGLGLAGNTHLKLTELYSQAALSTLSANSMRAKGFGENSVTETSSLTKSKEISSSEKSKSLTSNSYVLSDSDAVSVNISSAAQKYSELSNESSKPSSVNTSLLNITTKQGFNSVPGINLIA